MRRILARAAAVLALLALVPGGAWALARWGRLDLLGRVRWGQLFSRPDDGSLVLVALTVLGWLAWLLLVASLVCETIGAITHGAVHPELPGARLFAPLAAALVASVAGLVALQQPAPDEPCQAPPVVSPLDGAAAEPPPTGNGAPGGASAPSTRELVQHTVADGDDLWSLAERYYGSGEDWRRIVEANPGTVLSPLDRLRPGTMLQIPGPAGEPGQDAPAPGAERADDGPRQGRPLSHRVDDPVAVPGRTNAVQVDEGDSMWAIAREELGDGAQWPRIAELNRAAVSDPALIRPGQVLAVPAQQDSGETTTAGEPARENPPTSQAGRAPAPADTGAPGGAAADDETRDGATADEPAREDPPASRAEHAPAGTGAPGRTAAGDEARDGAAAPGAGTGGERAGTGEEEPGDGGAGQDDQARPLADERELSEHLLRTIGPIGATTAAVVVAALAARRRWQLNARPVGRRRPPIGARGRRVETALAAVATRARPEHAPGTGAGSHAGRGLADRTQPRRGGSVPVRLGSSAAGPVRVDLLARGVLTVDTLQPELSAGLQAALAIQLSDESGPAVQVRTGPGCAWLGRLDSPRIRTSPDGAHLRRELARLVAERSAALSGGRTAAELRQDPRLGEAWEPVVLLLDEPCEFTADELTRIGVCAVAPPAPGERAALELSEQRACLDGHEFEPELVMAPARRGIEELLDAADSTDFTKAWWWTTDTDLPDDIVPLRRGTDPAPSQEPTVPPANPTAPAPSTPFLRLLGPVELLGTQGPRPARAVRQCQEYCAWILMHPAGTAAQMTRELLVADTTRRSNMSRLRAWLGTDEDGEPYLPDAYSGRIRMHPQVTSDWEQLQLLITPGVNRVSDAALEQGLALVRGAPLADAAPGEWAWAEQERSDMISTIRDIGVELGGRRLGRGEYEQAGRAVGTALAAAPGDERLLQVLLRAEHLAGNRPEVERLVLQITRSARENGTDLTAETVTLLQEVMEGRRRARLA
ncbi:LysM peptidoglycan-binding domain-containing protein [Propionibacterium australiense]|uniref:LysM n=1 Tax=Propionibacterium australiense TaxID=119981 RepID=A0A383S7V8_9ACTN|nr:LysM peptidoglycan-binding domain-containing protein [Propionibacterium australiense]RLP08508.1 LysM peptidoglycan-binding domain-containing protein [Propionibacterium australiense]SYZ33642.1 LysM [Propionibacterium australiense]VEH88855.1 LysM domain/BON superfamily protein [Propionibacterium australiense]